MKENAKNKKPKITFGKIILINPKFKKQKL